MIKFFKRKSFDERITTLAENTAKEINRLTTQINELRKPNWMQQPQQQYRFKVNFINLGEPADCTKLMLEVMRVTLPKYYYDFTVSLDHERITLNFREIITGDIAKILKKQLSNQDVKTQKGLFGMEIQLLDGRADEPATISWKLENCHIESVDFGQCDYAVSDPICYYVQVAYEKASLMEPGQIEI